MSHTHSRYSFNTHTHTHTHTHFNIQFQHTVSTRAFQVQFQHTHFRCNFNTHISGCDTFKTQHRNIVKNISLQFSHTYLSFSTPLSNEHFVIGTKTSHSGNGIHGCSFCYQTKYFHTYTIDGSGGVVVTIH